MYRLGGRPDGEYRTLRESVMHAATAPLRKLRRARPADGSGDAADATELWALRDVNFDVQPGEVLGIIGRNGAGKSTLLKILSRITHPTDGSVEIRGRVGSLLEVGTGFHPELTGRENIYLNGAILGMGRKEIARKFDEIVEFAEVAKFLDTPVKRYSSGMYTRLAFAVASHLEPEVLVVDEVLAVGDAAFQKKCLGRMGQVSREGRTVLFVSHNMSAVKSLCTRGVLIEGGRVAYEGSVDVAVNRYLDAGSEAARTGIIPEDAHRVCDIKGMARLRSVRLTDLDGQDLTQLYFGQKFRVGLTCDVSKEIPDGHFEVSVSTLDGTHVSYATTIDGGASPLRIPPGRHEVWAEIDSTLLPRDYTLDVGVHLHNGMTLDFVQRTLDFSVLRVAEAGGDHYRWPKTRGFVRAPASWKVGSLTAAE
jgi:lipopolysaccharide transport system ATP-binding protein